MVVRRVKKGKREFKETFLLSASSVCSKCNVSLEIAMEVLCFTSGMTSGITFVLVHC